MSVSGGGRGWAWAASAGILLGMLAAGVPVRAVASYETTRWLSIEDGVFEMAQAGLLVLATVLCMTAMVKGRGGEWRWWVVPTFICFFMAWREIELDNRYLGENAFSWKYLLGYEPVAPWARVVMGVPSVGLSLLVLIHGVRHGRALARTIRRRRLRHGVVLFLAGIGLYLAAQVYDRAWGFVEDYGIFLPGFRAHRDTYWEELLELAGAVAVAMAVIRHFRLRPLMAEARAGRSPPENRSAAPVPPSASEESKPLDSEKGST